MSIFKGRYELGLQIINLFKPLYKTPEWGNHIEYFEYLYVNSLIMGGDFFQEISRFNNFKDLFRYMVDSYEQFIKEHKELVLYDPYKLAEVLNINLNK
jgi:hypothetical protein